MAVLYAAYVEVALARWQLAARLGVESWPEREQDAEILALHLGPLGPAWAELPSPLG